MLLAAVIVAFGAAQSYPALAPTASGLHDTRVSDIVATAHAAILRGDGPGALVAVGKLARARAVGSVPFLIEYISYDPNPLPEPLTIRGIVIVPPRPWLVASSHTDPFEHAPCVGALISIGTPARRAVLDMAATEERLDRLRAVAIVLRVSLGVAPAQAAVRRYAAGLETPAKCRLATLERLIGQ